MYFYRPHDIHHRLEKEDGSKGSVFLSSSLIINTVYTQGHWNSPSWTDDSIPNGKSDGLAQRRQTETQISLSAC